MKLEEEKPNINYHICVNYDKKNYELVVEFETTVSLLRKQIFDYFKIDSCSYDLFYRQNKINSNDLRPLALLFEKETNIKPLFFLLNKRIPRSSSMKPKFTVTLFNNYSEREMKSILNRFFEYKKLPYNVVLNSHVKGMHIIKFRKNLLAEEFQQFFVLNYDTNQKKNCDKVIFPPIKNKKFLSLSSENILEGVKKEELSTEGGRIDFAYNKNPESVLMFHYINPEEKFFRGKLLDKKNWLYKKGFCPSAGKLNMNYIYNEINNYVGATPNEPFVLYSFRDVEKYKWINKKGFYV